MSSLSPSSIEAVLFDFGLVLSGPPNATAWQSLRATLNLSEANFQIGYWRYRDDYDRGTLTGTAYWNAVAGTVLTSVTLATLKRLDTDLWTDLNEPMVAWAARLQHAGVRTGILSNIGDAMEQGVRQKLPWIAHFDHCVWSHAHLLRKPEAAIYLIAAQGLGVAIDTILFVDDRDENIAGAEAAGMQAILYRTQDEFLQELKRRNLLELWGQEMNGQETSVTHA